MAYANRIATTADPLPIAFVKLIDLPALPQSQFLNATPIFCAGANCMVSFSPDTISSNKPTLFSDSFNSTTPAFTGLLTMGIASGDYAIREAGTGASSEASEYFEDQGYVDTLYAGMNFTLTATTDSFFDDLINAGEAIYDPLVPIELQRQVLGAFTGGSASVVSANATESTSHTFDDALSGIHISYVGPSLASTVASPEALFFFDIAYYSESAQAQDKIGAFKVGPSGAVTTISLFKRDLVAEPVYGLGTTILAHCRDDTLHYFLRTCGNPGTGSEDEIAFTSCVESAWNTFSYNNYVAKFSDPDLPVKFSDIWRSVSPYLFTAVYNTDVGFLISYRKLESAVWNPKFILVDKAWTTVRHITATAADATSTAILAQGIGNGNENAISMMFEGGHAWLIGGTPDIPLLVEGAAGPDATPDDTEPTDDSTTLRVWGFSLDGHDFYVLRVGPSESLIYDLQTGQWSEWASPDQDKWRAHCGQNWVGMGPTAFARGFGSDVVCGDDVSGTLWILDPTSGLDDNTSTGSAAFTRMVIGGIPATGRTAIKCGAVQLTASLGNPALTGAAITLRTSDDGGNTYTSHGSLTVEAGNYDQVLEWRSLGVITQPGRVFELSDNGAAVRISGLDMR